MNPQQNLRTLRLVQKGPALWVWMNRPDARNAFNPAMIAELTQVFIDLAQGFDAGNEIGGPTVRVAVLAGEGRIFSAGADLAWMRSMAEYSAAENVEDARRLEALFRAIRDCPLPVVGRVQGAAMGGGSGLVAACDIAVCADDTRFAFSEARLGIVPAVISPFVLPKIGVAAARELFLTGEIFSAARAETIGLAQRVVAAEDLDAAVDERVGELLKAAPQAQAAIKRLIPNVDRMEDPEAVLSYTAELIAERRASQEGQEGMSAFLNRHKPAWIEVRDASDESPRNTETT